MTGFIRKVLIGLSLVFLVTLSLDEVYADWPDPLEVLETIAPYTGMNPDQLTAAKFYLDKPECASTIMSYTIAQDYSLVGFIGSLKATKLENLQKLGLPKLDKSTCKKYNPVEQAYIFINNQWDKILGKAQADFFRTILEDQIKSGMSELDAQIASIPYVGTVLTNWDCGCDAAFDTNFIVEKLADKTVWLVISVLQDVKKEDYGSALEKLVVEFWPKMACEIGAEWVGVGSIPIVSDVATKACNSIAGKAVDFVISWAGSIAETVGIIWGKHIPVEEYYTRMFRPEIGKYDYVGLASMLYGKCYSYYEKSNMSASTAKKACNALRDRYIKDSLGSIEHAAFYSERYGYYTKNYLPAIQSMATYGNKEFENALALLSSSCEKYFSLKYPNLKAYEKAYDNPITPYDAKFCDFQYSIKDARKSAQNALLFSVNAELQPFCKTSSVEKNVILCEADRINTCKNFLPKTCSDAKGSEFPCCKIGKGTDSVWDMNVKYASEIASSVGGGIYCTTDAKNPLKIACSLESSYKSCQKKFQYETNKNCSKTPTKNGAVNEVCCAYEPANLSKINGVDAAKTFVKEQVAKAPGSCSIGGMLEGYSFDPRIISCSKKTLPACKKKFAGACVKNSAGFVTGVCCEGYVFEGEEWQYDPLTRLKEHVTLAKKVLSESKGDCIAANTKNGEKDDFYIMCKSDAGVAACKQKLDRLALWSCSDKMTVSGFVSGPCCMKQVKNDVADADKKAKNTSATKKTTPSNINTTQSTPKKSTPTKRAPARTTSGEIRLKTPTIRQ